MFINKESFAFCVTMKLKYCFIFLILSIALYLPFPIDSESKPADQSLGINLNGIADWSTEYPFIDFVKSSREWIAQKKGSSWGKGGELDLNPEGWVQSLQPDQYADLIFVTINKGLVPYKRFIVNYEGEGEIVYSLNAKLVLQDLAKKKDIISLDSANDGYGILSIQKTNPLNPIRNITIVPEKFNSHFQKGEIFNPDWKEKISPFSTLRFMDWMKTNGSLIDTWQSRPIPSQISYAYKTKQGGEGVPVELLIRASNEIKADAWFNMPHLADDEYIREFAGIVKSKLNGNLKVYVEHSNEVWNWQFPQSHASLKNAETHWGKNGDGFMQWHGMRTAQICKIWKQVFDKDSQRIVCVFGTTMGKGIETSGLECPLYVKEGNEPCYKSFDAYSIAPYFSGRLSGGNNPVIVKTIESWIKSKDGGIKKGFEQISNSKYFEAHDSLTKLKEYFKYHKSVADKYKLDLIAYEGGQHITGNGHSTQELEKFTKYYTSLNRHPNMEKIYQEHISNWYKAGGGLFMHFSDIGTSSKYGSWGALESLNQKNSPKWKALLKFTHTK